MSFSIRTACVAVLAAAATAGGAADKAVDLNAPGALEKLQATNRAHYVKLKEILRGLEERRGRDLAQWLQTSFDARQVHYYDFYLTSYPAQQDISFVLDDTRYSLRFAVTGGARRIPAEER